MADAVVHLNQGQDTGAVTARRVEARAPVFGPGLLFVFAACAVGLPYSGLLPFTVIASAWPGANLAVALAAALILALAHAYTFGVLGATGRAGVPGEARGFSAALRFASNWTLGIFLALGSGVVIGTFFTEVLPLFARGLAALFGERALLNQIAAVNTQEGLVLYGSFGVLLVFGLLFLSPRSAVRVMLGGLALTLAAWLVVCVQLATGTPQAFHAAWDSMMGSGAFMAVLDEAGKNGIQYTGGLPAALGAGSAAGLLILSGYFLPAYFAGEVRSPVRYLTRVGAFAALTGGGLLLVGAALAQQSIPLEWLAAQGVLGQSAQFQGLTLPWLPFYAAVLNPNPLLYWGVGVGWLAGLLCLALALAYAASRIVLGWAEGGFLPQGAKFVHPELRSPLIAVLLVCMLVEAGLVISALGVEARWWLPLAIAGSQIVPVLGLVRLPFRKSALQGQAGTLAARKIGRVPLLTVTAGVSLAHMVATVVFLLLTPAFSEPARWGGIALLVVFGLGVIWYYGSRPGAEEKA